MAGRLRDREISPIQDVEKLCAELHAEVFRDSLDGVIFEQGEIQVRQSWPSQNITSGVAAKIEALGKSAEGGVTICRIEGGRRRCRDREALGLDVVVGIPGIYERPAPRTGQAIGKGPGVGAVQALRVPVGAERSCKRRPIVRLINRSQLPTVCDPGSRSGKRLSVRYLPSSADHQSPADIEVGHPAVQFQVEPEQACDRIDKFIWDGPGGASIYPPTPGKRALEGQTVAHSFR